MLASVFPAAMKAKGAITCNYGINNGGHHEMSRTGYTVLEARSHI